MHRLVVAALACTLLPVTAAENKPKQESETAAPGPFPLGFLAQTDSARVQVRPPLALGRTSASGSTVAGRTAVELVSVEKVWDRAPHNAFTDITRLNDRWFLTFREGEKHVSADGAIRVLSSSDGERWYPWALLDYPVADLRDPKLTVAPGGRLMLTAAGAMHPPSDIRHKTFVWYSGDGRDWSSAEVIGEPDYWLWRVSWRHGRAYGMGYQTGREESVIRPYMSLDGRRFQPLAPVALAEGSPNETSILFNRDDTALCLVRRESGSRTAMLGRSRPPYRGWMWEDLGVRFGGPHMIRIPDGRIVAAGRLYDGKQRTSLCWLDEEHNTLEEFLTLPSNGDSSYPGLVWHDDLLWVSYYSSHEGKSSIYIAKVRLPF